MQTHNRRVISPRMMAAGLLTTAIVIGGAALWKPVQVQSAPSPANSIPVQYTDVREAAHITFQHEATMTPEKNYIETVGNGVGWIDYDQDGLMDLYFVQSTGTDWFKPTRPLRSALYHNNGDGTFTDVTEKAGVGAEGLYAQGVAVGDFDNDGYPDMLVTGYGHTFLYHNNGNGTFTDVAAKAGVADDGNWSTSAGWFDYDKDGYLDLLICNYIVWTAKTNLWCGEHRPGFRAYCHPDDYRGQKTKLFHNNHNGTFTDVSDASGVGKPESKGMGVVLADLNNDGWPDIMIANDTWPNFLFLNNHDGTFKDVSFASGVAASDDGKYEAGMGVDAADVDGDGWPDIYVTHLAMELNRLYHNNHDETFDDATYPSGLGNTAVKLSGVSARMFDYDNDGWIDIAQVNGSMLDNISMYHADIAWKEPRLMYHNLGAGKFEKVSEQMGPDFMKPTVGRGLAAADFDNDGDIDLAVTNSNDFPLLLRNDGGNANNWLEVMLVGVKSNRDGRGAALKLSTEGFVEYRQAQGGMGYLCSHDPRIAFGLGRRKSVESLEITWPSGVVDKLANLPIDQIITVKEGMGIIPRKFPKINWK